MAKSGDCGLEDGFWDAWYTLSIKYFIAKLKIIQTHDWLSSVVKGLFQFI